MCFCGFARSARRSGRFPGTGKSQFARELARRIGYSFLEYKPSRSTNTCSPFAGAPAPSLILQQYGQSEKVVEAFFNIAHDMQTSFLC
eukprot:tig00000269_g23669.t1